MKLSAHPKLINRTVEEKHGITLDPKQMIKVKELSLLHLYASIAIIMLPQEHIKSFLSICRLLILNFSEN